MVKVPRNKWYLAGRFETPKPVFVLLVLLFWRNTGRFLIFKKSVSLQGLPCLCSKPRTITYCTEANNSNRISRSLWAAEAATEPVYGKSSKLENGSVASSCWRDAPCWILVVFLLYNCCIPLYFFVVAINTVWVVSFFVGWDVFCVLCKEWSSNISMRSMMACHSFSSSCF